MHKRFTPIFAAVLALLSLPAAAQYYTLEIDTQRRNEDYVIPREYGGNTLFLKFVVEDRNVPVNFTNWNVYFKYGYGQYDTSGMVTVEGSITSNTVTVIDTNQVVAGSYYWSLFGTNTTGYSKSWATGLMNVEYDPASSSELALILATTIDATDFIWTNLNTSGLTNLNVGGVVAGDKGDITVSGGTWTIDSGVVTPAKLDRAYLPTATGGSVSGDVTIVSSVLTLNQGSTQVLGTDVDSSTDPVLTLGSIRNPVANSHGFVNSQRISANEGTGHNEYDAYGIFQGGNYDHISSFQARPRFYGDGITRISSFQSFPYQDSTAGTITNMHHFEARNIVTNGTGDVITQYGFLVREELVAGTTNWAFYSVGATPSYMGGNLEVGGLLQFDSIASTNKTMTVSNLVTQTATIGDLTWDGTDGTAGQAIVTDGAGTLSFDDVAGLWTDDGDGTISRASDIDVAGDITLTATNSSLRFGVSTNAEMRVGVSDAEIVSIREDFNFLQFLTNNTVQIGSNVWLHGESGTTNGGFTVQGGDLDMGGDIVFDPATDQSKSIYFSTLASTQRLHYADASVNQDWDGFYMNGAGSRWLWDSDNMAEATATASNLIVRGDATITNLVSVGSLKINSNWQMQSESLDSVERLTIKGTGIDDAMELFLHPTGSADTSRLTISDDVNATNYDGISIEATTNQNTIGSIKAGNGTVRPLVLQMDGADALTIATNNNVSVAESLVVGGTSAIDDDPAIDIVRTITQTNTSAHGITDSTDVDNGQSYAAFNAETTYSANTNVNYAGTHHAVFQANPSYNHAGGMDNLYSFITSPANNGGTIGSWYGLKVNGPSGAGAFDAKYGVHVGSIAGSLTNNYYQLYLTGTTGRSFIAGSLGFGKTIALYPIHMQAVAVGRRQIEIENSLGNSIFTIWSDGGGDAQVNLGNSSGVNTVRLDAGNTSFINGGNLAVGHTSPDTKLDVNGAITSRALSADPDEPDEGSYVTWMSDGTESGDAGDIMQIITAGGVSKTNTLVDFSAIP